MSKRAAPGPDSRAAGKRRIGDADDVAPGDGGDELENYLFEGEGELDDLAAGDGFDGDLAGALARSGSADVSDSELDASLEQGLERVDSEVHSEVQESESEEAGELPFTDEELSTATDLDFSELTLSSAQARRAAELIAGNVVLTVIHFDGHDLPVSDLREEDELEWDSEEYTDTEAIIIAEILKKEGCQVKRLDLARNQITDHGARALALMLHTNTNLEYLNLESNMVGEKGAPSLLAPCPPAVVRAHRSHEASRACSPCDASRCECGLIAFYVHPQSSARTVVTRQVARARPAMPANVV